MYEQFNLFDFFQDLNNSDKTTSDFKIKNKVRLIELFSG